MHTLRRWTSSAWFPLVQVICVTVAWGAWSVHSAWGWTVILGASPWLVRALAGHRPGKLTAVDVAMLVFLLTAGMGVWASYDRDGSRAIFAHPVGWQKLWGLLLSVNLYYALAALKAKPAQHYTLALLAGLGVGATIVFIATHDWSSAPVKVAAIARAGEAIQNALWKSRLTGGGPNSNVIAGVVAPLLLLDVGLALDIRARAADTRGRTQSRGWLAWCALTGMVMLSGLVLTTSRGAWIALAVALALAGAWALARRCRLGWQRLGAFAGLIAGPLLLSGGLLVRRPALGAALLRHPDVANRLWIFLRGLLLVRDYPFTGSGLGNFALVDATYAQLIHVPTLAYSHALVLDVAIEQGIVGTIALLWIWAFAAGKGVWALGQTSARQPVLGAGLLALVAIVVHGLVDDALYTSRWVVLLWLPASVIAMALPHTPGMHRAWPRRLQRAAAVAAGIGVVAGLFAYRQMITPAWYANMGALAQTRAELPWYNYNHFDAPTLDDIRRREDLAVAEAYYKLALALDPGQVTARTRLAQIALARGDYDAALIHAQAAWDAGHRDRVTRLVLSDALVAHGKINQAASVAWGRTWAEERLQIQAFYRYRHNLDRRRALYAEHTALLLKP